MNVLALFLDIREAALDLGTRMGPRVGSSKGKGKAWTLLQRQKYRADEIDSSRLAADSFSCATLLESAGSPSLRAASPIAAASKYSLM